MCDPAGIVGPKQLTRTTTFLQILSVQYTSTRYYVNVPVVKTPHEPKHSTTQTNTTTQLTNVLDWTSPCSVAWIRLWTPRRRTIVKHQMGVCLVFQVNDDSNRLEGMHWQQLILVLLHLEAANWYRVRLCVCVWEGSYDKD